MQKAVGNAMTLIGEGAVFEGTMNVPHEVRIDGTFKGTLLESADTVTITEKGVVEADIKARKAFIGGRVIGNVTIEDRTELETHATLTGDLKTRTLVVHEGAQFQGKSVMGEGGAPSA